MSRLTDTNGCCAGETPRSGRDGVGVQERTLGAPKSVRYVYVDAPAELLAGLSDLLLVAESSTDSGVRAQADALRATVFRLYPLTRSDEDLGMVVAAVLPLVARARPRGNPNG